MQRVDVQASKCHNATRLFLINEKYKALQSRGIDEETLACLHEACEAKQQLYGPDHGWAMETTQDYSTCVNIVAAKLLRRGDILYAQRLLSKAHSLSMCDGRASTATLINLAVCMYSRELPEEAIRYLTLATDNSKNHYFAAEKHLDLAAAHFKRRGLERSLFHSQSAVHYAQEALTQLTKKSLPICFSKEALVLLALSYHSLAISLVAQGYRRTWAPSTQEEDAKGVTQMLEGVKWHVKAYEEIALEHQWAIPKRLAEGLWLAFVASCKRSYPVLSKAIDMDFLSQRADLRLIARIILQQTRANQIQRVMRASLLRREHAAAMRIQQGARKLFEAKRLKALQQQLETMPSVEQVPLHDEESLSCREEDEQRASLDIKLISKPRASSPKARNPSTIKTPSPSNRGTSSSTSRKKQHIIHATGSAVHGAFREWFGGSKSRRISAGSAPSPASASLAPSGKRRKRRTKKILVET